MTCQDQSVGMELESVGLGSAVCFGGGSGEIERAWGTGSWPLEDMKVDHRGFDAGVAHEGLDGSDVGSGLKEVGGEGMAAAAGHAPRA